MYYYYFGSPILLEKTIDVINRLLVPCCLESGTIILDPGTFIDFGGFLSFCSLVLLFYRYNYLYSRVSNIFSE